MAQPLSGSPLVAVAGNVGAGKSLVSADLSTRLGYQLFTERLDENPFFELSVADPERWAFQSQVTFMLNATESADLARQSEVGSVIERPVQEMLAIFGKTHLLNGTFNQDEYQRLSLIVEISERLSAAPDLLVALTATPEALLERVRARGRKGEDAYQLDFFKQLDERYQEFIEQWPGEKMIIDTDEHDLRQPIEQEQLAGDVLAALS